MANITLMGASYTDVPAVTLPQTGGGIATFYGNIVPYAIRPDAEFIQTYSYDKYVVADEKATWPGYTTTATTLKSAWNLSPTITVDLDNYRYFLVERFLSIPEYSVATKAKGRIEYQFCSYFYELARADANTLATYIDPTKKITSVTNIWATNQMYRILYWSSSSAISLYASNGYGTYQTPTAPSLSGSTLTVKSPALATRGSTSYFTSTYMGAVGDVRYQFVIDVYRAPLNSMGVDNWGQDQMLQRLLSCINSNNHKLT